MSQPPFLFDCTPLTLSRLGQLYCSRLCDNHRVNTMPEGSGHSLEDNPAKSSKRQGAVASAGSDPRMSQQGMPQRAGSGVSAFKVCARC